MKVVSKGATKRHREETKRSPIRHTFFRGPTYARVVMKGAFVVRLGVGTKPSENHFEGWAEEVDSGKEIKFHSLDELIRFFGERVQIGLTTDRNRLAGDTFVDEES